MDQADFFNQHQDYYGEVGARDWDLFFIDFLKNHLHQRKLKILDIGGGGGTFAKLCRDSIPASKILIVDPAIKMLAKQNIEGVEIGIGRLPSDLNLEERFDVIHIKAVLHHVTGNNIAESKKKLEESIITSKDLLNHGGYLLVGEVYYESFLYRTLTRSIIFYLLRIQNRLNVKVLPTEHFRLGLEVCFYSKSELEKAFERCNLDIVEKKEFAWPNAFHKRILLLRDWGRILYVLVNHQG